MNEYHCEHCEKDVNDFGPYELPSGDYVCATCYCDFQEHVLRSYQIIEELDE